MKRYGVQMDSEDPKRCIEEVSDKGVWHWHQCSFKRGKGKDGLYCGIHAKKHPKEE